MRHTFSSKVASLLLELPDYTEDLEIEWDLFKSKVITSAAASCGCKRVGGQMGLQLGEQTSHLSSFDFSTPQHVRLPPLLSINPKKVMGRNWTKV